jgi:hypothetical protein
MTKSVAITFMIFLGIAIITLLSKTYAFLGFGWSESWSNSESPQGGNSISAFVPANSIDQTSVILAQSSMSLLWQSIATNSSNKDNSDTNTTLRTLSNSKSLISYDIISTIEKNNEASTIITKHLLDLNQAITSLTQQSRTYQSQIEQSQSKLTDCSSNKKIADAAIIEAINSNNLQNINNLIQDSVTAGQCETHHRITINALTLVTKKHGQIISLLTKKANIIEQHKSTIAQYPEVIADPAIIKELSQLSSQL